MTMAERITDQQAEHWSNIASKLRQVSSLIGDCRLLLMLQLNMTAGRPLEAIEKLEDASAGMSYLFTPQTEWTGGDSSNHDNFKHTLPHIARKTPA
jgi:hypothetical protein